ncbi:MAG: zinc ribbon domain-containing protein [Candidatus Lokiarchaeota archaeon]|nr:zinc ribbon domain-containing protein [Candidatus Lokiarchaeota archaeon]
MMGWNSNTWFYIIIGLTSLVLLTILIIYLMNRNTKQEVSSKIFDKPASEPAINKTYQDSTSKFCPGCGEKILDTPSKYCSICGTQL